METVCPERARAVLQVAEAARDCAKLRQSNWRAYALLAVRAAAHTVGIDPSRLDRDFDAALEQWTGVQDDVSLDLIDRVRVDDWDSIDARLRALRATWSVPLARRELVRIELLVSQGRMAEAKGYVVQVRKTGLRREAERLMHMGLAGFGEKARFVGNGPAVEAVSRFVPSLSLIRACARRREVDPVRQLDSLHGAAKQLAPHHLPQALAELAPLAMRAGGNRLAASYANAPRCKNLRSHAWKLVKEQESMIGRSRHRDAPQSRDYERAQSIAESALRGARELLASTEDLSDLERGMQGLAMGSNTCQASYDEGRALGMGRKALAQALVRASARDLAQALANKGVLTRELQARRRTLRWIGGERVQRRWKDLLHRSRPGSPLYLRLLKDLANACPQTAARSFVEKASEWLETSDRGQEAANRIAQAGGPGSDLGAAWRSLLQSAKRHAPVGGRGWIKELVAVVPDLECLSAIARWIASGLIPPACFRHPPESLLAEIQTARERLRGIPVEELALLACSSDKQYEALELWSPVPHSVQWTRHKREIASSALQRAPSICVETFDRARGLFGAGNLGTEPKPVGSRHRIRALHPQEDLLTYLRFADWSKCCWSSTHSWWRNTSADAMRQFLDPLSFVYHLEVQDTFGAAWRPTGFVMGGLALDPRGTRMAVLNGLYLRGARSGLRKAVLGAIERHLESHYDLTEIGIARKHGGFGSIPYDYQPMETRCIQRLRALREGPRPIRDDIGGIANDWSEVRGLYWKPLPRSGVSKRA